MAIYLDGEYVRVGTTLNRTPDHFRSARGELETELLLTELKRVKQSLEFTFSQQHAKVFSGMGPPVGGGDWVPFITAEVPFQDAHACGRVLRALLDVLLMDPIRWAPIKIWPAGED